MSTEFRRRGIKKKVVIRKKAIPEISAEKAPEEFLETRRKMADAVADGRMIVFVDECLFVWHTIAGRAFHQKGYNIEIDSRIQQQ